MNPLFILIKKSMVQKSNQQSNTCEGKYMVRKNEAYKKAQLIFIGTSLHENKTIDIQYEDESITEISIPFIYEQKEEKGRIIKTKNAKKKYLFHLKDPVDNIIPLRYCLIDKEHIISTKLVFESETDQANDNNPGYVGVINMHLYVSNTESFIESERSLSKIMERYKKEMQTISEHFEEERKSFANELRTQKESFIAIIRDTNKELEKSLSEQYRLLLKSDQKVRVFVKDLIEEDYGELYGDSKEDLSQ